MSKGKWYLAVATALLMAACGGGGGGSTPTSPTSPTNPTAPKSVMVTISDYQFSPKDIQVNPGDTVVWTQTSTDPVHTVTDLAGSFDSGAIFTAVGKTFSRTFTAADNGHTINYFCRAHYGCCGMAGSIKVGDTAPPANPGY